MPEIDNDLFELLSLVGLGLIVLVGMAVWGAIGRLRKTLDRAVAEWDREAAWRGTAAAPALTAAEAEMPDAAAAEFEETHTRDQSEGPGVVAADEQREPELAAEPEPVAAAEPEPATAEPEPVAANEPEPAAAASEPEPVAAAEEREPGGAPEPQPVGEPEPEAHSAPAAAAEPEEQPFERDGRWWFRRGDELLVYDEMSGQWQPATSGTAATSSATQELPASGGESARGAETPIEAAQPGSFWKCPSCGAVNGSTATSCRMCFAARP